MPKQKIPEKNLLTTKKFLMKKKLTSLRISPQKNRKKNFPLKLFFLKIYAFKNRFQQKRILSLKKNPNKKKITKINS